MIYLRGITDEQGVQAQAKCKYLDFRGVKTPEPILMWAECSRSGPAEQLGSSAQCLPWKQFSLHIPENRL